MVAGLERFFGGYVAAFNRSLGASVASVSNLDDVL
jgi:hypothetical protein